MNSNVDNATLFLVNTVIGLYIYALLLRIALQVMRAEFYNPISQFIWRITNPPTAPLRAVIPRAGRWDLAAILVAYLCLLINLFAALAIIGVSASILQVAWLALLKAAVMLINLFTFAILIQAVMSWFGANMHSPATGLLWSLTEPMLRPVRRVIPPVGGLDLSPLVVIIALQVVNRLIPLPYILH